MYLIQLQYNQQNYTNHTLGCIGNTETSVSPSFMKLCQNNILNANYLKTIMTRCLQLYTRHSILCKKLSVLYSIDTWMTLTYICKICIFYGQSTIVRQENVMFALRTTIKNSRTALDMNLDELISISLVSSHKSKRQQQICVRCSAMQYPNTTSYNRLCVKLDIRCSYSGLTYLWKYFGG